MDLHAFNAVPCVSRNTEAPSRKKTNAFEILASARDACVAAFGKTKSNVFNIEGTSRELPEDVEDELGDELDKLVTRVKSSHASLTLKAMQQSNVPLNMDDMLNAALEDGDSSSWVNNPWVKKVAAKKEQEASTQHEKGRKQPPAYPGSPKACQSPRRGNADALEHLQVQRSCVSFSGSFSGLSPLRHSNLEQSSLAAGNGGGGRGGSCLGPGCSTAGVLAGSMFARGSHLSHSTNLGKVSNWSSDVPGDEENTGDENQDDSLLVRNDSCHSNLSGSPQPHMSFSTLSQGYASYTGPGQGSPLGKVHNADASILLGRGSLNGAAAAAARGGGLGSGSPTLSPAAGMDSLVCGRGSSPLSSTADKLNHAKHGRRSNMGRESCAGVDGGVCRLGSTGPEGGVCAAIKHSGTVPGMQVPMQLPARSGVMGSSGSLTPRQTESLPPSLQAASSSVGGGRVPQAGRRAGKA